MPSTHSSSISFFGVYLSLCIARLKPHPRFLPHLLSRRGDSNDFSLPIRALLTAAVLYGAVSVMWSRVRLGHHTPAQVIGGASVGGSLACICFWVWQTTLSSYAPLAERTVEGLMLLGLESWQTGSLQPLTSNVLALKAEWERSGSSKSFIDRQL
jgi:dolichyldiphosphatase